MPFPSNDQNNHLSSLYEHFDKSQIHLAISERVRNNPRREYRRMFRFLGLQPPPKAVYKEHNISPEIEINPELIEELRERYREPNERLFELLGKDIPEWSRPPIHL